MKSLTDIQCVEHTLKGNTYAFEILVNRYKDFVFSLAIKLVKDREWAEEVAQDVFIKVHKNLDRFKGDAKFSTWLYRIVYNTGLDALKKKETVYRTSKRCNLECFGKL